MSDGSKNSSVKDINWKNMLKHIRLKAIGLTKQQAKIHTRGNIQSPFGLQERNNNNEFLKSLKNVKLQIF